MKTRDPLRDLLPPSSSRSGPVIIADAEKRPSLVGLDEAEGQLTAELFFAELPWEPVRLDPKVMSAGSFLDAL